jgi:hypothetical protein
VVACNYSYQGNSSGGWTDEQWLRADFYRDGWKEADPENLGGRLVLIGNREQVIFVKKAEAGDSGRLRCNKYNPPFFLLCTEDPGPQD